MGMHRKEQVTTQRQQTEPEPRVDAPLEAVGAVQLLAPLTIEANSRGLDIAKTTVFDTDVAIAPQGNVVALDTDNAVKDKVLGCYLRQHGIADVDALRLAQQSLVATVFQERAQYVLLPTA